MKITKRSRYSMFVFFLLETLLALPIMIDFDHRHHFPPFIVSVFVLPLLDMQEISTT